MNTPACLCDRYVTMTRVHVRRMVSPWSFHQRNISSTLRSYHIGVFAWLGTITLETYLMQHHIWLTSNAKTRLVLIPDWPLCNMLLTTVIFVCASKLLFECTNEIRDVIMPNDAWGAWK